MDLYDSISNWCKSSIFIYPIILSIISSLLAAAIFYFFFNYLPIRKVKKDLSPEISYQCSKILLSIHFIFREMTNGKLNLKEIQREQLTLETIKINLTGVFPEDTLTSPARILNGHEAVIWESVSDILKQIQYNSEVLFRYIYYLDSDLIFTITEILRCTIFESWTIFPRKPFQINDNLYEINQHDNLEYADNLFYLYQRYNKLQSILLEQYNGTTTYIY